jgi:hypothetical protein
MGDSSVVLYGLIALAVLCFVLDRWVLPRDASPKAPEPKPAAQPYPARTWAASWHEANHRFEQGHIRRTKVKSEFLVRAIVDPRDALPTLTISCSGKVPWHEFSRQFATLELEDITDDDPRPIRCSDPDFSDPATGFCRFSPDIVFPSDELLDGPWDLAKVPLSSLSAPYAGRRKVKVNYLLGPRGSVPEDVTKRAVYVLELNLFNPGYDDELGAGRVAVQTMELAIVCGLAGRQSLGHALKVLSPWVDDILEAVKQEDAPYATALSSAMDRLWSEGLPEGYEVDRACGGVKACGAGTVDPALELCLRMATADGSWPKEAVIMVRRIAKLVGLDSGYVQALLDRHLLGSSVSPEGCDWESLTAMESSWDPARRHKHLVAYFNRWNARAASARTTTEQARIRSILEAIAKLRQKYA